MEVNGRRKGEVGNSHGECDDGHGTFGETQMGYFLGEWPGMCWPLHNLHPTLGVVPENGGIDA
jgi:hypothetical protein